MAEKPTTNTLDFLADMPGEHSEAIRDEAIKLNLLSEPKIEELTSRGAGSVFY